MKGLLHLLIGSVSSLYKRETPQQNSHERYILTVKDMLDVNNTIGVVDPTLGLLQNELLVNNMGTVTDPNCLQLTIADVAFTNAKLANNLDGQVASMIYRALERNTDAVGLASELCTSYTPRNVELTTFRQHQDPASPNSEMNNKAVVLELARQIAAIGGDPMDALYSGTFAPGNPNTQNATGNSCNTDDCIFTDNLLVRDASPSEIEEYVSDCVATVTVTLGASSTPVITSPLGASISTSSGTTSSSVTNTQVRTSSGTTEATTSSNQNTNTNANTNPPPPTSSTSNSNAQTQATSTTASASLPVVSNYQTFTGDLFNIPAPAVTGPNSSGQFAVAGDNGLFTILTQALARSCDNQKNLCADAANQQKASVTQCDDQQTQCKAETGSSSEN